MQGNRQIIFIDAPQILKQKFRLAARIDEEQSRSRAFDSLIDFAHRMACRMTGLGQPFPRVQNIDLRLGPTLNHDQPGLIVHFGVADILRHQPALQVGRLGNRGGKADGRRPGCSRRRRARPSDSKWPRFEVTSECNSSKIT